MPLIVSEDMQALGLENTFLAGYFAVGSPILKIIKTPGNERSDVSTQPDPYNQTTPSEMGELLSDVYFCARDGGGTLTAVFPEEITQGECQKMLDLLAQDKTGSLIQEGVPDGTRVAHKHGWIQDASYVIHDMSDAGYCIYTWGRFCTDCLPVPPGTDCLCCLQSAGRRFNPRGISFLQPAKSVNFPISTMSADPIRLEVFKHLFAAIAEEMGVVLRKASYSPNIKERRDFSCAVFDPQGRMIAQAAHIPVHLGAMPLSVEAAIQKFGMDNLQPGDVIVLERSFPWRNTSARHHHGDASVRHAR